MFHSNSNRRDFLTAMVLGASSLVGLPAKAAAEPPPEVRKIRLVHTPAICLSPQYIAEKFLHMEGFTDVEYMQSGDILAASIVAADRGFAAPHPVTTKRALRAFIKATEVCAREPARAARMMMDKGYEPRYDVGLKVLREPPYTRWREASAEDTLRFHAFRLHEVGMIKTHPNKLIP